MTTNISTVGELNLGHVLAACGIEPTDALAIRHTYNEEGLRPSDVTPGNVLAYVRVQSRRFNAQQPAIWLNFIADGGRRARFWGAFENHGEVVQERTEKSRSFDLRPSELMGALSNRLLVEWSRDTINWAKRGSVAGAFPVIEIADPQAIHFPGYDRVVLTHDELQSLVNDSRYAEWRTALGAVQGVYLIADTTTGRHYVGKADGAERIFGRWSAYARTGHGGNIALRQLLGSNVEHARHLVFSLLRVFGPDTPTEEVDKAESHFKRALLSREFGLNRN